MKGDIMAVLGCLWKYITGIKAHGKHPGAVKGDSLERKPTKGGDDVSLIVWTSTAYFTKMKKEL